ncbi:MAG: hypothetical protein ACLQDV_06005 [Candidatus Binataceae bacterium]
MDTSLSPGHKIVRFFVLPDKAMTALKDAVGPRNLIHGFATTTDDPTVFGVGMPAIVRTLAIVNGSQASAFATPLCY